MSKLNLQVAKGNGFNEQNKYAIKFDIKNYDTSAIPLSAVRVVSYAWLQHRNILGQFTSGVNATGNLSKFTTEIDPLNGIGQTGLVNLNLTDVSYRVYHNVVNSSKIAPQLTLNAPNGQQSHYTPISYANSTDTYFDILLNDVMPESGYTVTWFLPGSLEEYGTSSIAAGSPTISIEKVSEYIRTDNRKYDTKIVFSWTGNSNSINPNWGLKDTDVYININPSLYPSSFITSSWYSSLDDNNLANDPYFILEKWNGSSWEIVQEYISSTELDNQTGIISTDTNFLKIVNDGIGENKSVYISPYDINPISVNASDKDNLSLWSKNTLDDRRRSLLKFQISAIPSSATGIKNAILRLNVNSLTNAWNHYSTNGHVAVHRVTSDWTENYTTWSLNTYENPWITPGGDYDPTPAIWIGNSTLSTSFTSADQEKQFWMDFDVTDIVNYWRLNPSENYGFLIKLYDASNENNTSEIKWEINSGRLSGTGDILGLPQLLVSYKTLNTSGVTPIVEIKSPNTNSNIYNSTFSISGISNISSGQVENVDVYYRESTSVLPYTYFNTLNNNGVNSWYNTFSSLSSGSYDFILRAVSDLGNFGESIPVRLNFFNSPALTVSATEVCNDGQITLKGFLDISNQSPISGTLSYTKQYIPLDKKITCIIEDKVASGIVWVGTEGNGLYRVNHLSTSARVVNFKTTNSSISYDFINDIDMDSNGILWISYSGNGIGIFDSKNWQTQNQNDWFLYNHSNSSLSAYPSNAIDVCDIHIDSSDNKWFLLTWQNVDSIIKLVGNTFIDSNITKYSLGIYPRKIVTQGSYIFISSNDNRIFKYDSGWSSYTLPTFQNINDIDVDSYDTLWFATDSGIGILSATTLTELPISSTPSWPYGLQAGLGQPENRIAKSIFVGVSNHKWISFSTGNGLYNGGVVKYAWSNLTQKGLDNYFENFDSKRYSGITSDEVVKTIQLSANGYVWIVTDQGLSNINGYTRTNFSLDELNTPIILDNGSFEVTVDNPVYGNTNFEVDFEYASGEHFTSSFNINVSTTPNIEIKYPTSYLNTVPSSVQSKVLEYEVSDNDAQNGATVAVQVKKSPTQNGPWTTQYTYYNSLKYPIYETLSPEDLYYLKIETSNGSCSAESEVYTIYGNNTSTLNINPITEQYTTEDILNVTGNVYNKDFSKVLLVNGNNYTDSVDSLEFGYVTSAGFISVGFGSIISTIGSSANFSFSWTSPIVGVSSLSAISRTKFGTVAYGEVTFNAITQRPTITIISPNNNQEIALLQDFTLSASTQYLTNPVESLNFYIVNDSIVSAIGSATSAGINSWTKSFSPSAYGSGRYSIYATCLDNLSLSASSNYVDITINSLPEYFQISETSSTHSGIYTYQIKISDVDSYYNNLVEIISAGSVYTSGYANGFGDFIWNWVNPSNGIHNLSAKIYDGNPSVSSDYSLFPFTLDLNKIEITVSYPSYPLARVNNLEISPSVKVITTETNVIATPSVVGSDVSGVNYWLCDYDFSTSSYYKKEILETSVTNPYDVSLNLPSSRKYVNTSSRYNFYGIIAEAVSTNGSSIESDITYFYVKEQSISGEIFNNTCSNPIIFSGEFLDSDLPFSRLNTIIDNSISATVYELTSGTYLGTASQGSRIDENVPYTYSWVNPLSSVSAVSVMLVDAYGISASQTIDYGGLDVQPEISLLSGMNVIANTFGTFYLVSAGNVSVSAYTSAAKIKEVSFRFQTSSVETISADINKVGVINVPNTEGSFTLQAYVKTSGNCEDYSDPYYFVALRQISGNVYPDSCSTCYCNGGNLRISGNLYDPNFENASLIGYFGRSISAELYDNFDNLIANVTNQISYGQGTFETVWVNPVVGTSSVYLKVTDNNGVIQTISKVLSRSIYESPILNFISPVDYSISSTVYRQDDSIYFSSNVSSTDLIGVKYYVNGNLIGVSNNPSNGFLLDWNIDKLPGLYNVSAIALNSNGCYSIASKNIMVSNSPSTNFIYPVQNGYYQSGNILSAFVDSKGNSPAIVSAVNVSFANTIFPTVYSSASKLWETSLSAISSAVSNYTLSAFSYDTLNQVTVKEITINVSNAPEFNFTVSGLTNVSANYNTLIPIEISGYSINGSKLISAYLNISGVNVSITSSGINEFYREILVPRYFTSGNNLVSAYVIDDVGAIGIRTINLYIFPYTGLISYPVIKNVGSTPDSKVVYRL